MCGHGKEVNGKVQGSMASTVLRRAERGSGDVQETVATQCGIMKNVCRPTRGLGTRDEGRGEGSFNWDFPTFPTLSPELILSKAFIIK